MKNPTQSMNKFTNTPTEIELYTEILKNQLYFAVIKGKTGVKLKNNPDTFFFTVDDEFHYDNYYNDFGPLNVSCLYKYCCKLNKYLKYAKGLKSVVHYTCNNPERKTNAACLIGCYCVVYLNIHPKDTWRLLHDLGPYKPYLDAAQYSCGFTLKLLDCLYAIQKAVLFNFINFEDFNASEYDLYDNLQYGDMNWLVPRKFLAFIGPADNRTAHPPEFYIKYFLRNDVKTIIRLNNIIYDSVIFTQVGIEHIDLIFPDGTTPPKDILLKFLSVVETAPAAVAVHCKAGLGRTGSLIGAYLIKHYQMTAREAIAWMRLCRPGSVIGQQQIWLEKIENWLWKSGNQYRLQNYGTADKIPRHRYGIYSRLWPVQREKMISEARKKLQLTFTKSQLEKMAQKKKISASVDSIARANRSKSLGKATPTEPNFYKTITNLLSPTVDAKVVDNTNSKNFLTRIPRPNAVYGGNPELHPKSNMKISKITPTQNSMEKMNRLKSSVRNVTIDDRDEYHNNNRPKTSQGDRLNQIKVGWIDRRHQYLKEAGKIYH